MLAEEEADLVCTRCRNKARKSAVVYLVADGKAVHVAVKQAPRNGIPQVCGGIVVAPGEEWLARVAPGSVVRARRGADPTLHRVRLHRRLAARGPCGEWEGVALCGAAAPDWDPSVERRADGPACPGCALPLPQGI